MKKSEPGPFPYLDTCHRIDRGGVTYSMSLLALCGFHGRKEMVNLLLKEEAGNVDSYAQKYWYRAQPGNDKSKNYYHHLMEFFVLEKLSAMQAAKIFH